MSKFQAGLSGDFRRSDNQLEFADMELAALDDPNIEWRFVGELGAGTMAPEGRRRPGCADSPWPAHGS